MRHAVAFSGAYMDVSCEFTKEHSMLYSKFEIDLCSQLFTKYIAKRLRAYFMELSL